MDLLDGWLKREIFPSNKLWFPSFSKVHFFVLFSLFFLEVLIAQWGIIKRHWCSFLIANAPLVCVRLCRMLVPCLPWLIEPFLTLSQLRKNTGQVTGNLMIKVVLGCNAESTIVGLHCIRKVYTHIVIFFPLLFNICYLWMRVDGMNGFVHR